MVITNTKAEHKANKTQRKSKQCPHLKVEVDCPDEVFNDMWDERYAAETNMMHQTACLSDTCRIHGYAVPTATGTYFSNFGYFSGQNSNTLTKLFWSKKSWMTDPMDRPLPFPEQIQRAVNGEECMFTWMHTISDTLRNSGINLYLDFCDPYAACVAPLFDEEELWKPGGPHQELVVKSLKHAVKFADVFVQHPGADGAYCQGERDQGAVEHAARGLPRYDFLPPPGQAKYVHDPHAGSPMRGAYYIAEDLKNVVEQTGMGQVSFELEPPDSGSGVDIDVPQGSGPGDEVKFEWNGMEYTVTIPDGVYEGQQFHVDV